MKVMDPSKTGEVSMAIWQKNASKTPELFKQAHDLQAQLQKAYFGKSFWAKCMATRTRFEKGRLKASCLSRTLFLASRFLSSFFFSFYGQNVGQS
jgi:hypothetical protein